MIDDANGYRFSDQTDYTDSQLLQELKSNWNYGYSQQFDIIGRLKEVNLKERVIYFLEEMHSTNDGSVLLYPINDADVRQTVYVGNVNKSLFGNRPVDGAWVKARVELSPEKYRAKHKNPFLLRVVNDGLQVLLAIPEEVSTSEVLIDGQSHIEEWVINFYRTLHANKIEEEGKALHEQLIQQIDSQESRLDTLRQEVDMFQHEVTHQTFSLQELSAEIVIKNDLRTKLEAEYSHRKKTMEHQLDTLNQFIEKKAKMLVELDLVSQQEIDSLLNIISKESEREGHDFAVIFSSDVKRSVGYVQAYMYKKGIIYRRKVIEDFFALLTTHDLIILAGDSGSGKTNLVKSFADAIGGEARIIPVKPNWTSAEDLLGYYNPLEQKFLSTRFLDALFEADRNRNVPYLICLDEMNLARVEYYFADFLSLMEERGHAPEIHLYSDTEATHVVSEARNFLSLIDDAKVKLQKPDLLSFLDLLKDEEVNAKLHEMCGFREGDSLLKYHSHLRKVISSYLNTPSSICLPPNVRIIGTINVDETTHSLSPKILDRAHIIRFGSPLMSDWEEVENEIDTFDLDLNLPIKLDAAELGKREHYPSFDRDSPLVETLLYLVRVYLEPLGIEFGLRTVRQARLYSAALQRFGMDEDLILNNIVLHKLLPKLMFDGNKAVNESILRKDLLIGMRDYLEQQLIGFNSDGGIDSCIDEFDRVIRNAETNDWVVNYWSR